jgi:hypothetical protein
LGPIGPVVMLLIWLTRKQNMPLMLEKILMKTRGRPVRLEIPIFKVIMVRYPGN